jgi:hypothetical protein
MRGPTKRAILTPVVVASALGLIAAGAGIAQAGVASGTATLTVNTSFLAQLAKSGVAFVPQDYASIAYNASAGTVAVTYNATTGDASLVQFAGTISYTGGLFGFSLNGRTVEFSSLLFDLTDTQFDGQASAADGEVPLVDLAGSQSGNINGLTQTYSASGLAIDPAGAAYLDSALHTEAFVAGQQVGSFSTTWNTTS